MGHKEEETLIPTQVIILLYDLKYHAEEALLSSKNED